MSDGRFATAINCIDGRAQRPVANWMSLNLHVNYIDQITEPGPDLVVTRGTTGQIETIKQRVAVSVNAHHSQVVAIAAHYGCAGNPVSDDDHKAMVREAVQVIQSWGLPARVMGYWVNSLWQIEVIADSGADADAVTQVTFATAIACIDGRAKHPLTDWLKQYLSVNYIDLITEPEPEMYVTSAGYTELDYLRRKVAYSHGAHGSQIVAIAAHSHCEPFTAGSWQGILGFNASAAQPATPAEQIARVRQAAQIIASWGYPMRVIGVWLDDFWQAEIVSDTQARRITA